MADKELVQMIDKIDVNRDGYVDIDEFGALYQRIMEERDEEEDMREAFNEFDQNGDGGLQEVIQKGGCGWRWDGEL
ncbi:hypothetical protein RHMOL_Rhmol13G0066300 [Rhododendron molle]|uniref:Uncharacterized protein n=1 Tax=Rhododendron molle TaxID=49168 RepID=A0ACC0L4A7_RHOML|nr:hypothetical protein RHMOL_Rhmol13G0066300 [Rhododendron molle]